MAPKVPKMKNFLDRANEYRELALMKRKHKLKKKVWELSALCDVMVSMMVNIGPDGQVAKDNQEDVKASLVEYCPRKRLVDQSDFVEVAVEEIKKRTMDIDCNWLPSEETREMWKCLESQLHDVIQKTGMLVRDKQTTLSDMRESMMHIDRSFLVSSLVL